MNLNLDLTNYFNEVPVCAIAIIGNKIYKKNIFDKCYKLYKSFKNATKAKKYIKILELKEGIKLFSRSKNVYISDKLI